VNKSLRFIFISLLSFALTTLTAHAASFGNFDPRSLAMGGTGVSSANIDHATYYNPALLSIADEDDDFSLLVPTVGVRAFDPEELLDALEAYQDGQYETTFNNAINGYNAGNTSAADAATATEQLLNGLNSLSGKALDIEVHGGVNLAIPSKSLGIGVLAQFRAMAGINLNVTAADTNLIQRYIDTLVWLDTGSGTPDLTLYDSGSGDFYDPAGLTSSANLIGAYILEGGVALSHEFDFLGGISIGIVPKTVQVTTFDYSSAVEQADTDGDGSGANELEYSDSNIDVGIAKKLNENWKVGFVTKNLISKEYKTVLGNTIEIKPQSRVGISHHTNWTVFALDVDVTENESIGYTREKTRFVALGAELDFSLLQLRLGYRHNLSAEGDAEAGIASAGVGLYILGLHLDLGVAGSDDETEAALQLGIQF